MEKIIEIPEGYEARIEGNKVVLEPKKSEDENLKNKSGYYKAGKFLKASTLWKAVKDKTPQRVPNRYILQDCTWNIGSLREFAENMKNIQEVNLDYPIILDMNGNILDGAHRVVKAYLEGKDVDIVYLGDDEWPEPDYDEAEAVKESEDERIRGTLIDIVKSYESVYWCRRYACSKEEALAWLEKQKEQKINIDKLRKDIYQSGYNDGYQHGKEDAQKDRKPIQDKEEREYVRTLKSLVADFLRGKDEVDRGYYRKIYDWLDGRQKEQKPRRFKVGDIVTNGDDVYTIYHIGSDCYWLKEHDCATIPFEYEDKWCIVEQKSVEWSEEDEEMIDYAYGLCYAAHETAHSAQDANKATKCMSWLKSLRSQPHWKPSEEQMEALEYSLGDYHIMIFKERHELLSSLYHDLKKLM